VEDEIARLKDVAEQNQDWSYPRPSDMGQFNLIQRVHPRVVVPKYDEPSDEHKLMRKTRANWTLPTMN